MANDMSKNQQSTEKQPKDRRTTRGSAPVMADMPDIATVPVTPDATLQSVITDALHTAEPNLAPEPAPEPIAPIVPPAAAEKRASMALPLFLAAVLGGGAGLAGGAFGPNLLERSGWLGRTTSPDTASIQKLQADVTALAKRPAGEASNSTPGGLTQRLEETEASFRHDLQKLAASLAELRGLISAGSVDLAPIRQSIGTLDTALKTQISALSGRVEQAAGAANASAGAPIYVVTMGLAQAAQQGRSFTGEIAALEALGIAAPRLAALKTYASTGLPSTQKLTQDFAPVMRQITEATTPTAGGITGWAQSLVKVRAPAGNALARAETALSNNDIGAALSLLNGLPEPQKIIAAPFIASLSARLAATDALAALQQAATAGLQFSATGKTAP
jgi:hypothetical protein